MKKCVIIGAGPAGLTAAYELVTRTDMLPVVIEKLDMVGGLSRTVNYKGNRIDIGGHRFFSKSGRVMEWWLNVLPLENNVPNPFAKLSQAEDETGKQKGIGRTPEDVMLIRSRLSRIYFLKNFFSYPIALSFDTIMKLGIPRMVKIFFSYARARVFPIKNEQSLEEFFINRFGYELYDTFFKDYTEKVWGIPCSKISAEWGAQRIKGLSITKAVLHYAKKVTGNKDKDIRQKNTETSLIEQFFYPKYGPGQMWECVADFVTGKGGSLLYERDLKKVIVKGNKVTSVITTPRGSNVEDEHTGEFFFSSMPIKELLNIIEGDIPANVREVSQGLLYRDFITVGLLLKKMKIKRDPAESAGPKNTVKDNWIYIQEKEVQIGRLQIFNNWSPYMVKDPDTVWIGLEYFCNEGDELWSMPEDEFGKFAIDELAKIDIISKEDVLDSVVLKVEKAYPAYFGTYDRFEEIKDYVDKIENLFLIGRNGMHKYNNSDHSMLTAMVAVDNILQNKTTKENIWSINVEKEYHESSKHK